MVQEGYVCLMLSFDKLLCYPELGYIILYDIGKEQKWKHEKEESKALFDSTVIISKQDCMLLSGLLYKEVNWQGNANQKYYRCYHNSLL